MRQFDDSLLHRCAMSKSKPNQPGEDTCALARVSTLLAIIGTLAGCSSEPQPDPHPRTDVVALEYATNWDEIVFLRYETTADGEDPEQFTARRVAEIDKDGVTWNKIYAGSLDADPASVSGPFFYETWTEVGAMRMNEEDGAPMRVLPNPLKDGATWDNTIDDILYTSRAELIGALQIGDMKFEDVAKVVERSESAADTKTISHHAPGIGLVLLEVFEREELEHRMSLVEVGRVPDRSQSKLLGRWQDIRSGNVLEFRASGKAVIELPMMQPPGSGTWRYLSDGSGGIEIDHTESGGGVGKFRKPEFPDDDSLKLSDGNLIYTMKRIGSGLEADAMAGVWLISMTSDAGSRHLLTSRDADGRGTAEELFTNAERKTFTRREYSFGWKVLGNGIVEVESGGRPMVYEPITINSDEYTFKVVTFGDPNEVLTARRGSDLPSPPEGYTEVEYKNFWDE